MFQLLISSDELAQHIDTVQLLDCRAKLGDPAWGANAFLRGHITGARHLDLDTVLSVAPNEHGRHPLPTQQQWLNQVRAQAYVMMRKLWSTTTLAAALLRARGGCCGG